MTCLLSIIGISGSVSSGNDWDALDSGWDISIRHSQLEGLTVCSINQRSEFEPEAVRDVAGGTSSAARGANPRDSFRDIPEFLCCRSHKGLR